MTPRVTGDLGERNIQSNTFYHRPLPICSRLL